MRFWGIHMGIMYIVFYGGVVVAMVYLFFRKVEAVTRCWKWLSDCLDFYLEWYQTYRIPEFRDYDVKDKNKLYTRVWTYLNSLSSLEHCDSTNLFLSEPNEKIVLRLNPNQTIHDVFLGAKLWWTLEEDEKSKNRTLVLRIRRADKRRILDSYLNHMRAVSEDVEQKRRPEQKMYVNSDNKDGSRWIWMTLPFKHPSTFDTLSMESDLKDKVKSDLSSFLKAKNYYHRLGRVWRRSFLLYGPPGTGKSSFVAAMANFLCYDVYDIDLSRVSNCGDLKMLLVETTAKSVIVLEDFDRFLKERSKAGGVSGILNFMDGVLSSCCGDERIMVFTMTTKDGIDPALLRPGRIDVHIHFPVCDFSGFKNLAISYLGLKEHKLFPQVEEMFHSGASLSPAEIGELMIANRNSPSRALKSVITALQTEGEGIRRRSSVSMSGSVSEEVDSSSPMFLKDTSPMKDIRRLCSLLRPKRSRGCQSVDNSDFPAAGGSGLSPSPRFLSG